MGWPNIFARASMVVTSIEGQCRVARKRRARSPRRRRTLIRLCAGFDHESAVRLVAAVATLTHVNAARSGEHRFHDDARVLGLPADRSEGTALGAEYRSEEHTSELQ